MFLNPAEYAVSDCELGIFKTGSVKEASEVEIDLAELTSQINQRGFCLLKVESKEYYPDNNDKNQIKEIPIVGGWFVEMLNKGYLPEPSPEVSEWHCEVYRTNKGRTKIDCK